MIANAQNTITDYTENERGLCLVEKLAAVVENMVHSSERVVTPYYVQKSKFHAYRAPAISIRDYLLRIHKYMGCSPECYVLALIYIDRILCSRRLVLTELNVHRVIITSIVLAAKFFDDHYFNNAYYAKVGGLPCIEMNELEIEFLLMIDFTLHATAELYMRYYNELSSQYVHINSAMQQDVRYYVTWDPNQEGQLICASEVLTKYEVETEQHTNNWHHVHTNQSTKVRPHEQTTRIHASNVRNNSVTKNPNQRSSTTNSNAVALGVNA